VHTTFARPSKTRTWRRLGTKRRLSNLMMSSSPARGGSIRYIHTYKHTLSSSLRASRRCVHVIDNGCKCICMRNVNLPCPRTHLRMQPGRRAAERGRRGDSSLLQGLDVPPNDRSLEHYLRGVPLDRQVSLISILPVPPTANAAIPISFSYFASCILPFLVCPL